MAKKESTQHKLDRVRAPRVQLTYDVEVGDAIEKKELPFVAGVIGNFSGQPAEPLGKLKDRKFVNIDKDNYDDVLKGMKPRVQMQVDNKLADDGSKLGVELTFRSLEDFSPERVANQIEPLRKAAGGPPEAGRPAQQGGRQRQVRGPAERGAAEHRQDRPAEQGSRAEVRRMTRRATRA
jgi:type VI secretion system protein ImpB